MCTCEILKLHNKAKMEQQSSNLLKYHQQKSAIDEQQRLVNNQPPSLPLRKGCPRCNSSNTKFCYFNNYKLSQPRYFCRDCKRHWTQGGLLRDLPIGGTSRKERTPTKRATSRSNWGSHLYPVVSTAVSSLLQSTHTKPGPDVSMAGGSTFIPDNGISSAFPFQQPEVPRFNLAGGFKIPPFGSQRQQVFRLTRQTSSVDQIQFPSANPATPSVSPIGLNDSINASTKRETSRSNCRRNPYPAVSTTFSSRLQSTEPGWVNALPGVSMASGSTFIPDCGISSAFPFQQPEVPRFNLAGGLEITHSASQLQQQQLFHSTRKLLAVDQSQNLFARNSATPLVSPVGLNDGSNTFVPEDIVLSSNNMEMDGFQGNPYSCFP